MEKNSGNKEHVVVLGAGPAGLSAAWKLAEQGFRVTVVEKYGLPGGLCRTLRHGDFIFDLGGHRFLTQDTEVLNEIVTLMGDKLLARPRTSVILLRKHYFKYPLDTRDLLMKMNPFLSVKCFVDYLITRIRNRINPGPVKSFEDWVVSRFGRSLYNIYFGPYSKKLWGMSPTKISADWSAQRISLLNLWDVFLRLLWKKKDVPKTYATTFHYPKEGIGQIAEEMVARIEANGGTMLYEQCAGRVVHEGNRVNAVELRKRDGSTSMLEGDFFISTIPMDDLIRGMQPHDEAVLRAASSMTYRGVLFLFLTIDLEKVTDNTWMYIPEEEYFFFRIQEPRNWSPTLVPEGKTSLILEISCAVGDRIWNMSDEEVLSNCVESLKKLKLFDVSKISSYFTARIGHAYPIYYLDYKEHIEAAITYLNQFDNFLSIGREGLFRYNNMDHSIKMGFLAARFLQKKVSREDILRIASEQESFESSQAHV